MSIKPKTIFLDMDGTILSSQNKVSVQTKETIDALRAQGIFVFIATGRAYDEIEAMLPEGFKVDGFITSNGMAGYVDDKPVFEHSLSLDLVEHVIAQARKHEIYYEVFPYGAPRITLKQDQAYVLKEVADPKPDGVEENEWLSRKKAVNEEISFNDHLQGKGFSKFYFFARTQEKIQKWGDVLNEMKKDTDFTLSKSSNHNLELMVAEVNKASGISEMLEHFGLKNEDTLAIGDSDNDLQMFDFVTHSVAMHNAKDHIKDVVDEVTTLTCDENGVSDYLARFVEKTVTHP
ncbi:Cof-type HAD-IIB family hydrolase [Rossellomorea marisflavi]|uniref:Cof-type HAD-IIB family hydrolase n=1 Tax=Rossellomorea marisflavi TaxID=189381 RepID=UPI0013174711|nr:Cof-type HAD-IIB family hydrolase [Rossellomorea marisflavi]QHA36459.1 Cof-type HAD-IIB family hydrolase [Rossellomorea marisflavi]